MRCDECIKYAEVCYACEPVRKLESIIGYNGAKPTLSEVRAALATIYDIKGVVLQSRVQAEYYGEDGSVYSKIVRLIEKYEREHFA